MLKNNFILALFYLCIGSICVTGCSNMKDSAQVSEAVTSLAQESEEKKHEIALITDLGTIEDNSFNQAAYEGIKNYAEEYGISYQYYQPEEGTTYAYVEKIDLAIANGAKVVVCPGFLFETPVYIAQDKYPEVCFILIDGEPHNKAYSESRIEKNVLSILFQEEQAGFLAGYAAVKDGNKKLGFIGGMAVPAVIHYGYGFVQGCNFAAKEIGINTEIMYTYTGSFKASADTMEMAASWYQNGIEVIFSCGGEVGNSVIAAAEKENAKVIGVDVDQSVLSDTVITSAMKMIPLAVYSAVKEYYEGTFQGGTAQYFSAVNGGIGLPMKTSKFHSFLQKDYDKIYAKLVSGEITINNATDDSTTADLTLEAARVNYIN